MWEGREGIGITQPSGASEASMPMLMSESPAGIPFIGVVLFG